MIGEYNNIIFMPGPAVKIEVNMYIKSMGPVS